ncbi:hypothetical protein, partial [Bacillus cereus]|uniref:hypothetical protein n=1 Tax=Bacillus cereus TaxID=1396 RepID=UPI0034D70A75
ENNNINIGFNSYNLNSLISEQYRPHFQKAAPNKLYPLYDTLHNHHYFPHTHYLAVIDYSSTDDNV